MKGNEKLIKKLDDLLADELTAINQYMVHSEMCANWGYGRLHESVEKRAIQEMKHAEKLIGRILFLEAKPTVSKLNAIRVGQDVPEQFKADLASENQAVANYNEAIHLADEVGDAATKTLLEEILRDEDAHVDWLEEQNDQIAQMGVGIYLATQTR
ncbi:MAG TPA: bacterioferritin [Thermoguttaceae bacterium]|nr:bacterioferritin [Thermoguttaceae bacterium]